MVFIIGVDVIGTLAGWPVGRFSRPLRPLLLVCVPHAQHMRLCVPVFIDCVCACCGGTQVRYANGDANAAGGVEDAAFRPGHCNIRICAACCVQCHWRSGEVTGCAWFCCMCDFDVPVRLGSSSLGYTWMTWATQPKRTSMTCLRRCLRCLCWYHRSA